MNKLELATQKERAKQSLLLVLKNKQTKKKREREPLWVSLK